MPVREDWNRINNIRSSRVSILSGGDAPTAPFALLVACYNRLPITKAFFLNLQQQLAACAPGILDVYVFDDGSSDGTAEAILSIYPRAVILRGDGNFFWSASMSYLCHSIDARRYAGVMLVNDDIKLYDGALDDAIKAFGRVNAVGPTCLVGSFLAPDRSTITYSGWIRTESSPSACPPMPRIGAATPSTPIS
jgi:GT2 family glycosyltransferase